MSTAFTTFPKDIKNIILYYLDRTSIRAIRETSKQDRQFIESHPRFQADQKTIRATREYYETIAEKEGMTFWKWIARYCEGDYSLTKVVLRNLPCVNRIFDLEKESSKIFKDLPVSHYFGTSQEFASLPEFILPADDSKVDYETMPSPIVRSSLPLLGASVGPFGEDKTLTHKPAIVIRLKSGDRQDLPARVVSLVYSRLWHLWCLHECIPRNVEAKLLDRENKVPYITSPKYSEVARKLLVDKEYTHSDGHTYKVV